MVDYSLSDPVLWDEESQSSFRSEITRRLEVHISTARGDCYAQLVVFCRVGELLVDGLEPAFLLLIPQGFLHRLRLAFS